MLWFAVPYDIRRFKQMKYGRILRGPQLLSPEEFNKQQKGDGIGFKTTELGKMMRIPRRKEAQHFQIMGDTGVGKTQLIMQILRQIRERGDSAIVYDPACEYLQRFYDKERGDIVLNPLDERCPYWGPAQEMASNAEADAIAASLYQPADGRQGRVLSSDAGTDIRPSLEERPDAPSARRMDGKQRHAGDVGRWHGDVFLHRPQGRPAAGGRPRFARIGGEMLPSPARKGPDRRALGMPGHGRRNARVGSSLRPVRRSAKRFALCTPFGLTCLSCACSPRRSHGYAVTSHSSQGLTAGRVLANIDTDSSRNLINTRLAYVAISRASDDARVYTNNAETLGERLASDITKTAAHDLALGTSGDSGLPRHEIMSPSATKSRIPIPALREIEHEGIGIAR
jgi:hypothetical protein